MQRFYTLPRFRRELNAVGLLTLRPWVHSRLSKNLSPVHLLAFHNDEVLTIIEQEHSGSMRPQGDRIGRISASEAGVNGEGRLDVDRSGRLSAAFDGASLGRARTLELRKRFRACEFVALGLRETLTLFFRGRRASLQRRFVS